MSESLEDFVKKNSKFLRLNDGEEFTGTYMGFKVVPNSFDPDKDTVLYKLAYEDGQEISWQNGSTKVAREISPMEIGTKIIIKRTGEGTKNTKYEISKG